MNFIKKNCIVLVLLEKLKRKEMKGNNITIWLNLFKLETEATKDVLMNKR